MADSVDTSSAALSVTPEGAMNTNSSETSIPASQVVFANAGFERKEKTDGDQTQIQKESKGTLVPMAGGAEVTGDSSLPAWCCFMLAWQKLLKDKLQEHRQVLTQCVRVVLVLLYLAYSGYALYRQWGTESATRLWLVLAIVLWLSGGGHVFRLIVNRLGQVHVNLDTSGHLRKVTRWLLYLASAAGAVVYLAVEVAPHHPNNIISLVGIAFLVLFSLLLSTHPERVNWHTVFWGLSLQFYLALFLLRTQAGSEMFDWLATRLQEFISYTNEGCRFLFGEAYIMHPVVFQSLPVILFINAVIAAGYHVGAVQAIVASFGGFLAWCLDTTSIESVNAAANLFLGLAEAPLLFKPFLEHVTESELFSIMTGGFASIAGVFIAIVIDLGIPSNHILAATVMSAPAALAVAKLMCPEKPGETHISAQDINQSNARRSSSNLLEVVSKASVQGVAVVATICANVIVFVSFIAFADRTLEWFGDQAGVEDLTFSRVMAYLFYPLMYVFGVDTQDLLSMGRLAGVKLLAGTFVSYQEVSIIIANSRTFQNYTTMTNGTWHHDGFDVVLDDWDRTLVGGILTDRSIVMSTYILCGFSSVGACAIGIGALSGLIPSRTRLILKHVVWACVAGNIACFLTGCIAGLLYTPASEY